MAEKSTRMHVASVSFPLASPKNYVNSSWSDPLDWQKVVILCIKSKCSRFEVV